MKILHVSYSDLRGGAAIGAYRLHKTLRDYGIDSNMLVVDKLSDDPSVQKLTSKESVKLQVFSNRQNADFKGLYGNEELAIRSFNLIGLDASEAINNSDCDVVHFHWVAGNTVRLLDMPKIQKPIVWKMPDMWPFSGAEHYINYFDEKRYKVGYDVSNAPSTGVDMDKLVWEIKKASYANLSLTVTSPSRYLAKCAHESVLLSEFDAHVIPNPLPDEFVYCVAPTKQRRLLQRMQNKLPLNKKICFFSAFSAAEKRKGYHHFEEVLNLHLKQLIDPSRLAFVVVGGDRYHVEKINGYDVYFVPRIDSQEVYINLFQCADVFLCPSEMDSTAMVVQEANAMGVPSVVFDVGGMPELVHHKRNGFVAEPYNASELAKGLHWILEKGDADEMANYGRSLCQSMHNRYVCASRYVDVYEGVRRRASQLSDFKTGQLHDRVVSATDAATHRSTVYLLDPSVVGMGDTSHNAETALAFSASFVAAGYNVVWLINGSSTLDNPYGETHRIFQYTAYDKVRSSIDVREGGNQGAFLQYKDLNWPEERDVSDALSAFFLQRKTSFRDAIFVPMVDRILLDGLITTFMTVRTRNFPKLFLNFMFEKGNFLTGGYPLEKMAASLRATKGIGRWIFPCVETTSMAEVLRPFFDNVPLVVRPAHVFQPGFIAEEFPSELGTDQFSGAIEAYQLAHNRKNGSQPQSSILEKRKEELWVGVFGRGRRDKGWARLPDIIAKFNAQNIAHNVKFIVQRPRAMDNLSAELLVMERIPNVILLDEILDDAELNAYQESVDIFLLPYDKAVYGSRGSAFVWRAIVEEKPLVVSKFTGLEEGVISRNGIAADSNDDFADAILEIFNEYTSFERKTRQAAVNYCRDVVFANPIWRRIDRDGFVNSKIVCIVVTTDMDILSLSGLVTKDESCVIVRIGPFVSNGGECTARDTSAITVLDYCPNIPDKKQIFDDTWMLDAFKNHAFDRVVLMDALFDIPWISDPILAWSGAGKVSKLSSNMAVLGRYTDLPDLDSSIDLLYVGEASYLHKIEPTARAVLARAMVKANQLGINVNVENEKDIIDVCAQLRGLPEEKLLLLSDAPQDIIRVASDLQKHLQQSQARISFGNGWIDGVDNISFNNIKYITNLAELIIPNDFDGAARGRIALTGRRLGSETPIPKLSLKIEDHTVHGVVKADAADFFTIFFPILFSVSDASKPIQLLVEEPEKRKKGQKIEGILFSHCYFLKTPGEWSKGVSINFDDIQEYKNSDGDYSIPIPRIDDSLFKIDATIQSQADETSGKSITVSYGDRVLPSRFKQAKIDTWTQEFQIIPDAQLEHFTIKLQSIAEGGSLHLELFPSLSLHNRMPISELKIENVLKTGHDNPRSRYMMSQLLLRNIIFRNQVIEEARIKFVVHDAMPFLAICGTDWLEPSNNGGKYGDAIKLFPHRHSMYEIGLSALPINQLDLLVAIGLEMPAIFELAYSSRKSLPHIFEPAQLLARALSVTPPNHTEIRSGGQVLKNIV